ncbi:MAG: flagellar assembly protein FliW [Deltaproteobacteria bacterium]|nr:flagellar assembly protein FliW [Deltaproteobacteria bacterium]
MKINTSRFGEIEIRESELIVMKGSILGFENLNRFVLLINDAKTPLWWMQCVDTPSVAFVVVNPRIIKPDYDPVVLEGHREFLDIKNSDDMALLSIVTVRSHPFRVTANLRAPILINAAKRMANQIVLEDPDYPIQYDVLDHKADFDRGLSDEPGGPGGLDKLSFTTAAI